MMFLYPPRCEAELVGPSPFIQESDPEQLWRCRLANGGLSLGEALLLCGLEYLDGRY